MEINPRSLENLKPGANKKNAVRVTLTLKPETVKLLRMTGNMSAAVDKFIELQLFAIVCTTRVAYLTGSKNRPQ
jgi:hypothetical protein